MRWVVGLVLVGCVDSRFDPETHWEEGQLGEWRPGLTVAQAGGCSTGIVAGLSAQLIDEINCLRPNTLVDFRGANVAVGGVVWPYLQPGGAAGLRAAVAARGQRIEVNSALRTLAQQYLLYRWYQEGACGIGLAARPGRSNHESGLAIDIEDNAGWRNALSAQDFDWFGADDPVHFDYRGGGTVELAGLSVLAFQRLWNRNHPEDRIDEDGLYGPQTEARLRASPTEGFAVGACVVEPPDPPEPDPPEDMPPPPPPVDASVPTDAPDRGRPPEAPDGALPEVDAAPPEAVLDAAPVTAPEKPPEAPPPERPPESPPEDPGETPVGTDAEVLDPLGDSATTAARQVGLAGCQVHAAPGSLAWLWLGLYGVMRGRHRWRAAARSRRQAGSSK